MKKTFSTLAAFLLGAVISITVVACADDLKESLTGECNCEEKWADINEQIAKLSKDVLELNTAATKCNVATYDAYWTDLGYTCNSASFIYDTNGRIIEAKVSNGNDSNSYVITYENNVCTVYKNGSTAYIYTLDNKQSTDFSYVNLLIQSKFCS